MGFIYYQCIKCLDVFSFNELEKLKIEYTLKNKKFNQIYICPICRGSKGFNILGVNKK